MLRFPIMSIAVSAIVRPSRFLLAMVGAMCSVTAVIGYFIACSYAGDISVAARMLISGCVIFLAVFGVYHGVRYRKIIHIDISGEGRFRLAELESASPCTNANRPHVRGIGQMVRLSGSSTIWPHLLLLRLQADNGKITTVSILPDSVSRDSFRALAVACRWVVERGDTQECKNS